MSKQSIHLSEYEVTFSSRTVVDWYNFARMVFSERCKNSSEKVGGEGKIVEIYQSQFGKRKNHKGRIVQGQWVWGGGGRIERDSDRVKCLLVTVEDTVADHTASY